MLGRDFYNLLRTGQQVSIEFRQDCLNWEGYEEPGMRARICGAPREPNSDGVFQVSISFKEFDEFNKQFESSNYYDTNYYDRNRQPTLTAREAGYYTETTKMYLGMDDPMDGYFVVLDDLPLYALYQQHIQDGGTKSYVQFLEWLVSAVIVDSQVREKVLDSFSNSGIKS